MMQLLDCVWSWLEKSRRLTPFYHKMLPKELFLYGYWGSLIPDGDV